MDPKWSHINVEEKERGEEKMRRRRTTRKFEQSPPMGSSFSVKGRSVEPIARNALFHGLSDLFSEEFNDDFRFKVGKAKVITRIDNYLCYMNINNV